jgi:WD40 repeat protein
MSEFEPYSWTGILEYINTQKLNSERERNEWKTERNNFLMVLQEKDIIIANLRYENKELQTRISILEYTMRQESQKNKKMHHRINSDQLATKSKALKNKLNILDEGAKYSPVHRPSQSYGGFTETKFEQVNVPPAKINLDTKPYTKKAWSPKLCLKSHLDGIRGLHFASPKVMASVSEDCTVKLWDCRNFLAESEIIESYLTLRGHTAPVLTIDGGQGMIYTGDCKGVIRSWTVPDPEEVERYGHYKNNCLTKWAGHSDCVWCLRYNPVDNFIATSSSDNTVKVWKVPLEYKGNQPSCKIFSFPGLYNTPTACNWVTTNYKYITVGYSSFITVFNVETSGFSKIPYTSEGLGTNHQVNCIYTSSSTSLTVSGHEDKRIRFFDLNSNSCIKDMVGHTDSVTDISLDTSGFYMISTGHDGSVRSWDLRNFHCLHEVTINRKKYDESIFCVAQHPELPILATGGSDSLIKILEAKDN